jgi:hypothetical protein
VTAHFESLQLKAAFATHIRGLGLGSDEAAWLLFRGELLNRWLVRTLRWDPES